MPHVGWSILLANTSAYRSLLRGLTETNSTMRVLMCVLWCGLMLSAGNAQAQERCISLITSAGGNAFWSEVRRGVLDTAAEMEIPLYARGPARDGDTAVQLSLLNRMLKFNCNVLIIAPSGPEIAPRMAELKAAGIQGIYLDRDLGDQAVLSAIATDNYAAGLQAGQRMASLLKGRGKVALLRLNAQVQSTSERERGFLQGAKKAGLQVVMDRYLPLTDPQAMARLGEELKGLDGLFTPSEGTTLEVLAVLRRMDMAGKLVHVGFDSSPLLLDALQRQEISALMVQQPRLLGFESVARARRVLDGDLSGPRRVQLPAVYVDKDNLDTPSIQRLLMP